MILFAAIIFFISLFGIGALFYMKHLELRRARVLNSSLKERADLYALNLKELLARGRSEAAKSIPIATYLMRLAVHEFALRSAALLQYGERKAHELADLVGHKHHFERRETKSAFLKQVGEHPFRSANNSNGIITSGEVPKPLDLSALATPTSQPSVPTSPKRKNRKVKRLE